MFDVGANVGLFSLYLGLSYEDLTVFAFEPIPDLLSMLQDNMRQHAPAVTLIPLGFGLSDHDGPAVFELDPFMTITASTQRDNADSAIRRDVSPRVWAELTVRDLAQAGIISGRQAHGFARALDNVWLRPVALSLYTGMVLFTKLRRRLYLQRVAGHLRTLSAVMREHDVGRIDLLKIDAEGCELEVLDGLAEEDWSKIRQAVLEVHDVDGRVDRMRTLFESKGFSTAVDQDDWATGRLAGLYLLYARRV